MSDLARLFATDPLKLTKEDFTLIVTEMRKNRAAFQAGNIKAGTMKPKTEKQKASAEGIAAMDKALGGLELDL